MAKNVTSCNVVSFVPTTAAPSTDENPMSDRLSQYLAIDIPLIQAPMAGVSTPELAAAVSNAGALGSLGLGASSVARAREAIRRTRALTDRPFNVNLFCHAPPARDAAAEAAWIEVLRPQFARFQAEPPQQLAEIYASFRGHREMLEMLLEERPAVVSFHFGLPDAGAIASLHDRGIMLAAMTLGADGVQLGTAFLLCQESAADEGYRRALSAPGERRTWLTAAISGRPARCVDNAFCALGRRADPRVIAPYPLAYDAGKALATAARAQGEEGYGAHWAGQGVNLLREMPAAALIAALREEYRRAAGQRSDRP